MWSVSRSDTTNLLMSRVRAAIERKDVDLAIKLLDAVVKIKPDYVEAWNRRATLFYLKKEYGRALAPNIGEVEPRTAPFARMSGLVSSCRISATTSTRSTPIARRSRSTRACSASPSW